MKSHTIHGGWAVSASRAQRAVGAVWFVFAGLLGAGCADDTVPDTSRVLAGSHVLSGDEVDQLRHVQIVVGDLLLSDVASLDSLEALAEVRGDLTIKDSPALTSLRGLEQLMRVGGALRIQGNLGLASLHGLEGLEEVGRELLLSGLPELHDLSGLDALLRVGTDLRVERNERLESLAGLGAASGLGPSLGGDLLIAGNAGLASIHFGDNPLSGPLANSVIINDNPSLREIGNVGRPRDRSGPCGVTEFSLWIFENDALEQVALSLVFSRDACVSISRNPRLRRISVDANTFMGGLTLLELPALASVETLQPLDFQSLAIVQTGLATLDGLQGQVHCMLDIDGNPALTELSALQAGPGAVASRLHVHDNPLLPACAVEAMIEAATTPTHACVEPDLGRARLEREVVQRGNDATAVCTDGG